MPLSPAWTRSGNHDCFTLEGQTAVRAQDVSLILDLRDTWKAGRFLRRCL